MEKKVAADCTVANDSMWLPVPNTWKAFSSECLIAGVDRWAGRSHEVLKLWIQPRINWIAYLQTEVDSSEVVIGGPYCTCKYSNGLHWSVRSKFNSAIAIERAEVNRYCKNATIFKAFDLSVNG